MASLFHDKVFVVSLAAASVIHLAVLSGVPSFSTSRRPPPEEGYIEFIYYQTQADRAGVEPADVEVEEAEAPPVEARAVELHDAEALSEKDGPIEEPRPQSMERRIAIKVREDPGPPARIRDARMFEEGRLINEYARTLDRIIEPYRYDSYPDLARARSIEGSVVLRIRVSRDGSLKNVTPLEDTCVGSPAFKAAAIGLVKRASARFPPFPEGISREEILFTLPVSFTLD